MISLMKLFILKTNIRTERQLRKIKPVLQQNNDITRWSIDLEDVDKVLKVETKMDSQEVEMIELLRSKGINCEELPD